MIHLEVLTCSDPDLIGNFKFSKNLIYIGKDLGDLRVLDSSLINQYLFIEIYEEKIIAQPHKKIDFFLVNGKRTTGPKFLKRGHIIDLKEIKFKLIDFKFTEFKTIRQKMNELTEEFINNNHPVIDVIQIIQEE